MKKNLLSIGFSIAVASLMLLNACGDPEIIYTPDTSEESGKLVSIELLTSDNPDRDVRAKFTPGADIVKYEFAIGTTDDLADFQSGKLDGETVEGTEATDHVFTYLETGATYMVFARGYTADGRSGSVTSLIAHTSVIVIEPDFIGSESMAWKIAPSLAYRAIEYKLSTSLDNPDDVISAYGKDDLVKPWTATFFDLTPETKYYLTVRAQDRYGEWTDDIVTEVTTKSFEEVPGLALTIDLCDFWLTKHTYTPNSQTGFYSFVFTEGGALGLESFEIMSTEGDYRKYFIDNVINVQNPANPLKIYTAEETIVWASAYQALEVPYELYAMLSGPNDSEPTIISRISWSTPTYDESADEAEVGVSVVPTASDVTVTWTPNEATEGFYYEIFDPQFFADMEIMGIEDEEAYVTEWFQNNAITLQVDRMQEDWVTGQMVLVKRQFNYRYLPGEPDFYWEPTWTYTYSEMDNEMYPAGTEFTLYAMPLNKNGLFDGVGKLTKVTYTKL